MKYLVMVKDDVEAGDERMKEFEQELQDMGLFDTSFSLGDILEDEDQEPEEVDDNPKKKRKLDEFPPIEGEETLPEYLGTIQKSLFNPKSKPQVVQRAAGERQVDWIWDACLNSKPWLVTLKYHDFGGKEIEQTEQTMVTEVRLRSDLKALEESSGDIALSFQRLDLDLCQVEKKNL